MADRIVRDVAAKGWPEGEVIGSEPELIEKYGVSRAVFREAIRLVEHRQVASMRRGPGGGLVVTPSNSDSAVDAVIMYLAYAHVRVEEVFEARLAVETRIAELAPTRLREGDIAQLRELAQRERDGETHDRRELHTLLARISGNPGFEFFVALLTRLSFLFLPDIAEVSPKNQRGAHDAHVAIIEAVIAGDVGLSRHRMDSHLEAEARFLRRRASKGLEASVIAKMDRSGKLAQAIAWDIFAEILAEGWPVGSVVGSEIDLMTQYGCSRAVLREAVRLLEHHEVAKMRRGVGGGLTIIEPGIGAATDAVALNLERSGITPRQLFEVRSAVEMAIVSLVVERLDAAGIEALRAALAVEQVTPDPTFPRIGHDLHDVLAHLSGNRVLELLGRVLVRLTRLRQALPEGERLEGSSRAAINAHERLVEAIIDGDLELSRHRMRRHLDALSKWVQ